MPVSEIILSSFGTQQNIRPDPILVRDRARFLFAHEDRAGLSQPLLCVPSQVPAVVVASALWLTCHQGGDPEAAQAQRQPLHGSAGRCQAGSHQSAANCCPAPADVSAGRPHSLTLQHVIALTDLQCTFLTVKLIMWHGCDAWTHV